MNTVAVRVVESIRAAVLRLPRNKVKVAAGAGVVWTLIALIRMLWPGPVGLADSGDGTRLMCRLGAAAAQTSGTPGAFWLPFWPAHEYFGEGCGVTPTGDTYYSSQVVLLRLARWAGSVVGLPAGIDLRMLAALCAVLVGIGVAVWIVALPPSVPMTMRLLVGCAVGLIMVDSGIARFFGSTYPEPAALIGIMFLLPALLWLFRSRRYTWGPLIAVTGVGGFTILATPEMAGLLPVLAGALLLRPSSPSTTRWAAEGGRLRRRLPALALVAVLTTLVAVQVSGQAKRYTEVNGYGTLFGLILPMSPDPAGDLAWFDLDPELIAGTGTDIHSPGSVAYEPSYAGFADKVTPVSIATFYLTHPGRLGRLADIGMRGMADYNTERYLAGHPADAGVAPFTPDSRITVVSSVYSVYRDVPAFVMLHWLAAVALFAGALFAARPRRGHRALALTGAVTVAMLTVQFWTVLVTTGGHEISRHMIVADLVLFLTVPIAGAMLSQRRRAHRAKARLARGKARITSEAA